MTYLLLLVVGLGIVWSGIAIKEEVYRLTAAVAGAILLVWGFSITPTPFQIFAEMIAVFSVFSICVRCCGKQP